MHGSRLGLSGLSSGLAWFRSLPCLAIPLAWGLGHPLHPLHPLPLTSPCDLHSLVLPSSVHSPKLCAPLPIDPCRDIKYWTNPWRSLTIILSITTLTSSQGASTAELSSIAGLLDVKVELHRIRSIHDVVCLVLSGLSFMLVDH